MVRFLLRPDVLRVVRMVSALVCGYGMALDSVSRRLGADRPHWPWVVVLGLVALGELSAWLSERREKGGS
jgi:hypothetical protein